MPFKVAWPESDAGGGAVELEVSAWCNLLGTYEEGPLKVTLVNDVAKIQGRTKEADMARELVKLNEPRDGRGAHRGGHAGAHARRGGEGGRASRELRERAHDGLPRRRRGRVGPDGAGPRGRRGAFLHGVGLRGGGRRRRRPFSPERARSAARSRRSRRPRARTRLALLSLVGARRIGPLVYDRLREVAEARAGRRKPAGRVGAARGGRAWARKLARKTC